MTPEQEEKLAALKGDYLANLAKVRQAAHKEERDRAIAEHINSYIAEVGNDGELADAFLTWLNEPTTLGFSRRRGILEEVWGPLAALSPAQASSAHNSGRSAAQAEIASIGADCTVLWPMLM